MYSFISNVRWLSVWCVLLDDAIQLRGDWYKVLSQPFQGAPDIAVVSCLSRVRSPISDAVGRNLCMTSSQFEHLPPLFVSVCHVL